MNDGWIKLYRKLLDSAVFGHEGLLKLWILCLLKASHEEQEVILPGLVTPIKLKPGQFITGRNALHFDYHQGHLRKRYSLKLAPTPKTLFRYLLVFKKMQNLSIKPTNKYSMVSVVNWDEHQQIVQQMGQQMGQQVSTYKNVKNIKNKYSPEVQELFVYWQEKMNHPKAKLTNDRKAKIGARLREGFTVDQIKVAIDGCKASPYHMGENDTKTVYDDLTLICRAGAKLEFFMEQTKRREVDWKEKFPNF